MVLTEFASWTPANARRVMVLLGLIAASGATVSSSGTGMSANHVVYGRIPPRQNVRAGNYSDTVNLRHCQTNLTPQWLVPNFYE